jgi:hypothetical protein
MKKLVLIAVALFGINSFAETDPNQEWHTCTAGDLRSLEAATHFAPDAIKNLVDTEVLENLEHCYVQKPRYFHPAVCGTQITQIDTFVITTSTQSNYTVVVDSSYQSCVRIRRIPVIKSLSYEPEQVAIPFNQ